MLNKPMEKKLDGNYTRNLRAILNMSWRQHPTKQQLNGHLPPITKLSKLDKPDMRDTTGEVVTNILQWTPSHGRTKAGRPGRTYIQQFCANTGCRLEHLPEAMDDREEWRKRVRETHNDGATWWWWWCKWFLCKVIIFSDVDNLL